MRAHVPRALVSNADSTVDRDDVDEPRQSGWGVSLLVYEFTVLGSGLCRRRSLLVASITAFNSSPRSHGFGTPFGISSVGSGIGARERPSQNPYGTGLDLV